MSINELVLENPKNTSGLSYGIMARSYSHFDVKFYTLLFSHTLVWDGLSISKEAWWFVWPILVIYSIEAPLRVET